MNELDKKKNLRPRQAAWWYGDGERWRWVATAAVIMLLVGVFTYQNPQLWQEEQLLSAEEQVVPQQLAEVLLPAPIAEAEPQPQTVTPRPQTQVDVPPLYVEQLAEAVAVGSAPESWLKPLSGSMQRSYGFGYDQTCADYRFHSGVDYAAVVGEKVQAMAAGTVVSVTEDALWGGVVVVEHGGGWLSIYKGLVVQVKQGAQLEAGDIVGAVMEFAAESAQNSHLHLEMYLDGECVDPKAWL